MWPKILQEMFTAKQITTKGLKAAVTEKLITAADYKTITGTDYAATATTGGTT